ncbi:MAG: FAD-dependent oxidoreductase, partial [Thaumarchaeota archaeon]|nr:FAD-dependent oxidoreductase [Nitrososphaerota archaeon]
IPAIKGAELEGVRRALDFLIDVKKGLVKRLEGRVWVIGGGDVAVDAARTALRLGASEVKIMYRRSRREMPANPEEVEEALEEGVEIVFLAQPIEIIGRDGRVSKIRCVRMRLGEPGPDGRRRPIPVEGSEFEVEADHVLFATGETPSTDWVSEKCGIELTERGMIKVNERLETSRRGVFAGGDVVRGASTYTIASADGIKAAREIDRYLRELKRTLGRP